MHWEIRELSTPQDLEACENLQREVWGGDETEVVPVSHLVAAHCAGGLVAGAVIGGELAGFAYGFPADRPTEQRGRLGLHSHMLAVHPKARSLGMGRRLKWFQRAWCRGRGIGWIEWTFDPLRLKNARLNLEHLGAWSDTFLPDVYGPMHDALNNGMATDRLLAFWDLDDPAVAGLAELVPRAPAAVPEVKALERCGDAPDEPKLDLTEPRVGVELPADLDALLRSDPEAARAWRERVGEVLRHYLGAGYRAARVAKAGYVLERVN